MDVKEFIKSNFRHFNAAVVVDAAEAWGEHLKKKGKMFLAMAGALSTGEIGISLGEMIRKDKIDAICCTGANLEEDIFNLIAHKSYKRIPHYRQLTPKDELDLKHKHLNRITDTCIPEEEAVRKLETRLYPLWEKAEKKNESHFPYEYIYQLIRDGELKDY